MSAAAPRGSAPPPWYLRARIALPVLAVLIVLITVLTPVPANPRGGDARLTTYSTSPMGASAAYELAQRLGWSVTRQRGPAWPAADSAAPAAAPADAIHADTAAAGAGTRPARSGAAPADAIHAELALPDPLGPRAVHALLQRVRRGAALLVVIRPGAPLADSLHVRLGREASGGVLALAPWLEAAPDSCASQRSGVLGDYGGGLPLWPDGRVHIYSLGWTAPPPADTVTFGYSTAGKDTRVPAVVGFHYGRGRVVVYSDPDMLRNDVLRVCRWRTDVLYVRALEYLTAAPAAGRRIVFDEFHQGFGPHPGSTSAIAGFLTRTSPGRVLSQLLLAALVLLLAAGARPAPPLPDRTPARRSPLEHVDALARAYARVDATRTVVERLVAGVRRRVARGVPDATQPRSHAEFLAEAAAAQPELAADTALVARALGRTLSARELEAVGDALQRIETALSTHGKEGAPSQRKP